MSVACIKSVHVICNGQFFFLFLCHHYGECNACATWVVCLVLIFGFEFEGTNCEEALRLVAVRMLVMSRKPNVVVPSNGCTAASSTVEPQQMNNVICVCCFFVVVGLSYIIPLPAHMRGLKAKDTTLFQSTQASGAPGENQPCQ